MATQERVYTIDDVWRLEQAPLQPTRKYYLIDGELRSKMSPSQLHGEIASEIARRLGNYVIERGLGRVTVEVGYHPPGDRKTVLLPDVAFEGLPRAAQPSRSTYVPYMPDLAVEIVSPSQSLAESRRKAKAYLRHGTALVWLVNPADKSAEVWTATTAGAPQNETIDLDGAFRGGSVLPGFSLPLERVFPD
jgi:Uma2 family endonuclease